MKIAVANLKGGVGKSFLAQNLAWCLATQNVKTCLVEPDGVASVTELLEWAEPAGLQVLKQSAWTVHQESGTLGLLDMQPGLGAGEVFEAASHVMLVTTASPPSLLATLRTARLALCANPKLEVGIVVNGGPPRVAETVQRALAKHLSARAVILGNVPWDETVQRAESRRRLLMDWRPNSLAAKAVRGLAASVQAWEPGLNALEFLSDWRPASKTPDQAAA